MPSPSQQSGSWAESVAEEFLRRKGYVIRARHVTSRYGEIDLAAMDNDVLVAVEVKYRRNGAFGAAEESVDRKKLENIAATLETFRAEQHLGDVPMRVDVVTVQDEGSTARVSHFAGVEGFPEQ